MFMLIQYKSIFEILKFFDKSCYAIHYLWILIINSQSYIRKDFLRANFLPSVYRLIRSLSVKEFDMSAWFFYENFKYLRKKENDTFCMKWIIQKNITKIWNNKYKKFVR